ncbi:MAG TPA: hypothetical protein VMP68_21240 [Candidatus Eisenbacteria bacterium]|nr:hypothetical protein [Candidatus Eisenbacteria bacterium]
MFGRCAFGLLTLMLLLDSALAQTVAARQTQKIAPEPGVERLRVAEPVTHYPRFPLSDPDTSGLPAFADAAGMIFSGTVARIERRAGQADQTLATLDITFHVENSIRGATTGRDLTISQWAGLWSMGQRYRVGERIVLFLYPASKLGLTSWVGGELGRFAIDASGRVQLSSQQISRLRRDPVLGGRSRVPFSDFALAVRRASGEE